MRDRTDLDALTMRVIDLEQWRRRLEHPLQKSTVPPCPPWCTAGYLPLEAHAEYDLVTDEPGALQRHHACEVGALTVVQTETVRAGVVTLSPAEVHIYDDEAQTAERARQLARDFEAAAELLDRINGSEKAGA